LKLFPIVLIALIAEIAVWIGVAQFISGWYVFFWFIIAFFIGLNMMRGSAAAIMPQMQQMKMTGQMNGDIAANGNISKLIAGFLLMIPGLISDVLALLLLIPAVQRLFRNLFMRMIARRQQAMMEKMMGGMMGNMGGGAAGQNPFEDLMRQMQNQQQGGGRYQDSNVIDGEAHEVEPDRKQISMKDVNPKQ